MEIIMSHLPKDAVYNQNWWIYVLIKCYDNKKESIDLKQVQIKL